MARPPATALNVDPRLLALIVLLVAIWFRVVRRSREPATEGSNWRCLGAIVLLAGVWITPLATLAQHYLLAAHLLQVLILMGPVPALLLLSLPRNAGIAPVGPGSVAARCAPARRDRCSQCRLHRLAYRPRTTPRSRTGGCTT